ncbi:MAG: DUF6702 family protein [Bacteroidota bacterium]
MKRNAILILALSVLLGYNFKTWHNPLMANYTITETEGEWTVDINFTPKGANNALKKYYSGLKISQINPLKFNQLLMKYLKSTIQILTDDGKVINLGKGQVKTTEHEIVVAFKPKDIPAEIKDWQLTIKSFAENPGHYNIVKFIGGGVRQTLVFSQKNAYQLVLNPSE